MFKFLVVASFVALAITQTSAASQSYVTAAESFTGTSSCAPGTNNANIYAATIAFGDTTTQTAYTTGLCNTTLSGSISYSYTSGLLQKWAYTTANCTGNATITNLTTSCANNTATNGFPSSAQTVAIAYTPGQLPTLSGFLSVLTDNSKPVSGSFAAAGVCLRTPSSTYVKWNSTKYTCAGATSAATASYYSDNACATPYVAPPATPYTIPPTPPTPPSPYSYLYFCTNSGAPVAAPVAPTSGGTPSAPGSPSGSSPSGSTPGAPKSPSAAATSVLSAAAAAIAGVALLF